MLIKKDPATLRGYLEDSSHLEGGYADKIIIPETVGEVFSVLKEANAAKTPVTVSGAGTGQAGGRVPFGGLVLSTEKLARIKEIKKSDKGGHVALEAGVVISSVKEACERAGLFYTYDPTEQTAFVGGTIATNASGARSFKYGSTRKCVRALSIALADGTIFELKRGDVKARGRALDFEANGKRYEFNLPSYRMPRTKNSAGYYAEDNMDLVDLFVGQEGTLGVIVGAELLLPDKPKGIFSCFAFFTDEPGACGFAAAAREKGLLAIEYFDKNSLGLLREKYANVPGNAKEAIFFEDEITEDEESVLEKWENLLSSRGVSLDDTWVAANEKARKEFFEKRHYMGERMDEMAGRSGFSKVHTDLAVPNEMLPEMLEFYGRSLSGSGLKFFLFGHIGDAHLHLNMLPAGRRDYEKAQKLLLEFVKKAIALGGTVSAEHGIGKTKREFLKRLYGEKGVAEMAAVKRALDPNMILGRGNIFANG